MEFRECVSVRISLSLGFPSILNKINVNRSSQETADPVPKAVLLDLTAEENILNIIQ